MVSQTLFSSYNDSDSNQTLRFNRHMSRMSLTTNMQQPNKKEKSKDKEDRAKVGKSPKDS